MYAVVHTTSDRVSGGRGEEEDPEEASGRRRAGTGRAPALGAAINFSIARERNTSPCCCRACVVSLGSFLLALCVPSSSTSSSSMNFDIVTVLQF